MSSDDETHDAVKLLSDDGAVEGMDAIITSIGEFGRFQRMVYGGLTYCWVPLAIVTLSYVFISPEKVAWKCMSSDHPLCNNTDVQLDEGMRCNMTRGVDWVFVDPKHTVTAEFSLVCDDAWKAPVLASIFFVGLGFGAFMGGYFSGPYGRKKVYLFAMSMTLVSTILGTFSKSFGGYAAARFFQGVFNGMFGLTAFVLANEYVGKGWVGTTGTLSNFIFPVGELILAGIAYSVPAWRAQTLVSCLTFVPCLIMPFILLPESARWLLSQGRDEEAMVMLRLVAKTNKTDFPANAILKPPTNISVQEYADFCWQALAEFPGILLAWVGLDNRRTGRRGTMVLSFSVGGVACGLMIFLQKAPAGARTVMVRWGYSPSVPEWAPSSRR
eukprot:gene1942-22104_t